MNELQIMYLLVFSLAVLLLGVYFRSMKSMHFMGNKIKYLEMALSEAKEELRKEKIYSGNITRHCKELKAMGSEDDDEGFFHEIE